jgi:ribose transport system substrate-binding protein
MNHHSKRANILGACLLVASTSILAACSAAEPDDKGSAAGTSSTGSAADLGDCGTLPTKAPEDPDGALAAIGDSVSADYNGFPEPITPSPWKDWKPEGPGPYDVAIIYSTTAVPYQADLLDSVKQGLEASDLVGDVKVTTYENDPATAIRNFQAAVNDAPDLILYQPLASDPFVPLVDDAAKKGIPSIAIQSTVASPNSVNVTPNPYLLGGAPTAELLKLMGGKGTLLAVHGVPGVPIETQTFDGIKAAVSECPDITLDDSVVGGYNPATAKTEVSKYLTTHPGEIAGVTHAAIMGSGILGAFEQSGRPVPPIADVAATEGGLAYWKANEPDWTGTGSGQGAKSIGAVIAEVATRMLSGDGPLVNTISLAPPLITADNLDEWATGTDTTSAASVEPPAGTYPAPGFLDAVFGTN